jgi:hypothetical protein
MKQQSSVKLKFAVQLEFVVLGKAKEITTRNPTAAAMIRGCT